jgi:hypothetical protein
MTPLITCPFCNLLVIADNAKLSHVAVDEIDDFYCPTLIKLGKNSFSHYGRFTGVNHIYYTAYLSKYRFLFNGSKIEISLYDMNNYKVFNIMKNSLFNDFINICKRFEKVSILL